MSYDKNNKGSIAIIIVMTASIMTLAVVTIASSNHSYTAFAVSNKSNGGGIVVPTRGGVSSSTSAGISNANTITKKQLSSFISCINTANKSAQGLTHKVVTNCLDIARGTLASIPATSSSGSGGSTSKSVSSLILPS